MNMTLERRIILMFEELEQEDQFFLIGRLTTIAERNHRNVGQSKKEGNPAGSSGGNVISLDTFRKRRFA